MKKFYADFEREKYIIECEKEDMTEELKKLCLWSPITKQWISKCKCTIKEGVKTCKASEYNFIKILHTNGFEKIEKEAEYTKEELENQRIERLKKSIASNKEKAKRLKSEYEGYSGDISFFTQPNINTTKGITFSNYRERVIKNYTKGIELNIYISEQEKQLKELEALNKLKVYGE